MSERSIFLAALNIADPADRAAFLEGQCGGDAALRRHLEELVAAEARLGGFLNRPHAAVDLTDDLRPAMERPGSQIGPYKLIQLLGEGGMGVVYMAQQTEPVKRLVALKIIKPGMDSRQVIARFEAERQALALMDHPNIAKVLDAGTTESSRPYFVMELVKGIPITTYCDEKRLTPRQRLELFIPVCHAVQHAHQKGIVHRDLKPSNVMIALYDGRPVPKVIDFGVAKAAGGQLTEKTLVTSFGSLVGTLEYMSPEQAELNQLDVDTRSDIYSLGVLLYELLTGDTPFDKKRLRSAAFDEMLRIIREEEPPLPSTRLGTSGSLPAVAASRQIDPTKLAGVIRGEIDWIIMKALEKDRSRRYETANGLARDIQRYLADESVEACPPSLGYRLSKISRRYRTPLTIAASFAALLLAGSAFSAWQAIRAKSAEAIALASQRRAIAAAEAAQEAKVAEAAQRQAAEASEQTAIQERNNALAARQELNHTIYALDMAQVQAAGENRQFARVAQLLDLQRPAPGKPDYRGFEWHYWHRVLQRNRLRSVEVPQLGSRSRLPDTRSITRGAARLAAVVDYLGDPSPQRGLGLVAIFDGATGRELVAPFEPFPDLETTGSRRLILTMSKSGTRLVVAVVKRPGSTDPRAGHISIRDGGTGSELHRLENPGNPHEISLTTDGSLLAVAYAEVEDTDGSRQMGVKVWDTTTGEVVQTLPIVHASGESVFARTLWSPDGAWLLRELVTTETKDNERTYHSVLQNVHVASGKELWKFEFSSVPGSVRAWSFSPDGKLLIIADPRIAGKPALQLCDSTTLTPLAILDREAASWIIDSTIDFTPDGKRFAVASQGKDIYLWDIPKLPLAAAAVPLRIAAPDLTLRTSGERILALAFSESGRELHSVAGTSIETWDATAREDTGFGPDSIDRFATVEISADAAKVVISGQPTNPRFSGPLPPQDAIVWDLVNRREACRLKTDLATYDDLVFSPDGRRVARVQNTNTPEETPQIVIHDAQTGEVLNTLQLDTLPADQHLSSWNPAYYVYPVFRPDGVQMAALIRPSSRSQSRDLRRLMAWDVATGKQLFSVVPNAAYTYGLYYSQDGASLVTAATDRPQASVKFFDAATGDYQRSVSMRNTSSNSFINIRHQLFGNFVGSDHVIWDLATGQERLRLPGFTDPSSYAISPDGSRIVFGTPPVASRGGESEVSLWSLKTGRRLLALKRQGTIAKLSFSPDGNRLVGVFSQTGSSALKPIQIWDATPLPDVDAK